MKKISLIIATCLLSVYGFSQESRGYNMPLIGQQAPSFTAISTHGRINFPDDYFAKWKILFSHPSDFTPVCTSEIIELAMISGDLQKLNTEVAVISTDGLNSHNEWVNSMEKMWYKNQDPVKISFPLISDNDLVISKLYGMIQPTNSDRKDIRGVFIIDPSNKIRSILFYPDNVGRNMEEIKRIIIALQKTDKETILTPANWKPGDDVLLPAPSSIEEASRMSLKSDPNKYKYDWYLWFQKQSGK